MVVQDCYIHDIATNGLYAKGGARLCVIERNRVYNVGGIGIVLGFYTDADFFDSTNTPYYESIDSVVRNNVVAHCNLAGIGLYAALRPKVYNNTLVNVAMGGQAGITLAPGTVWISDTQYAYAPNRDVEIYNNIVSVSPANDRPAVEIRVVDGWTALAGTIGINNNVYHVPGGAAAFEDERASFYGDLVAWRMRIAGESHSKEADPLLDAANNYRLTLASPALNAGRALTGFANDINQESRPQGLAWDVGADEYPQGPPPDTTPPTAAIASAPMVKYGRGTNYKLQVRYTDNVALDAATFDGRDILVTGPNGFAQIPTLFRVDVAGNGPTRTVTYRLAAPGGTWDAADNGTYTISVRKSQVGDTAGNFAPRTTLGTFTVRIAPTTTTATTTPTAAPNPLRGFATTRRITELSVIAP